jgi:hypothetical protein
LALGNRFATGRVETVEDPLLSGNEAFSITQSVITNSFTAQLSTSWKTQSAQDSLRIFMITLSAVRLYSAARPVV